MYRIAYGHNWLVNRYGIVCDHHLYGNAAPKYLYHCSKHKRTGHDTPQTDSSLNRRCQRRGGPELTRGSYYSPITQAKNYFCPFSFVKATCGWSCSYWLHWLSAAHTMFNCRRAPPDPGLTRTAIDETIPTIAQRRNATRGPRHVPNFSLTSASSATRAAFLASFCRCSWVGTTSPDATFASNSSTCLIFLLSAFICSAARRAIRGCAVPRAGRAVAHGRACSVRQPAQAKVVAQGAVSSALNPASRPGLTGNRARRFHAGASRAWIRS